MLPKRRQLLKRNCSTLGPSYGRVFALAVTRLDAIEASILSDFGHASYYFPVISLAAATISFAPGNHAFSAIPNGKTVSGAATTLIGSSRDKMLR